MVIQAGTKTDYGSWLQSGQDWGLSQSVILEIYKATHLLSTCSQRDSFQQRDDNVVRLVLILFAFKLHRRLMINKQKTRIEMIRDREWNGSLGDTRTSWIRNDQGHPTSIFGKYLFGGRFEIQNFRNIFCKIYCLPTSRRIFEHLKIGPELI